VILFDKMLDHFNPSKNPKIESGTKHLTVYLPTLWLLGKTGSGKSTLIQNVTGDSQVEIGGGFRPCTMSSKSYDFPSDKPLLRFLDTRGLAEANYDAGEDIAACERRTNALIVVMKVEEPEQGSVLNALKQVRKSGSIKQILLVHTGAHLLAKGSERNQCIAHNQSQVESVWKRSVDSVAVDFELENGSTIGVDKLNSKLAELLPIISLLVAEKPY
jgi:predicted GTPase